MVKYIVFDFDGTLVDSKDVFISVFNQLAGKYGFRTIEAENLEYIRQLSIKERFKYLKVPLYKMPFLSADFIRLYKSSMDSVKLVDGIKSLFEELEKRGFKITIISSNTKSNIWRFLRTNKIDHVVEVYCSRNIFRKDRVITKFLKASQLRNEEIIYVGDEVRDIAACRKSAVRVIGVSWGYDNRETLTAECPDYIAESPKDILEILTSLPAVPRAV
jgi:phosphoglycolate phosphatase